MKKIILFGLLLWACTGPQEEKPPAHLLAPEKLRDVLVDIHIVEAFVGEKKMSEDSMKQILPGYYDDIFEKHELSRDLFFESFHYYLEHPSSLDSLYEDLIEELSSRQLEDPGRPYKPPFPKFKGIRNRIKKKSEA